MDCRHPPLDHHRLVLSDGRNLVGAWWSYHVLAGGATGRGIRWRMPPLSLAAGHCLFSIRYRCKKRGGCLKVWNLSLIIIRFQFDDLRLFSRDREFCLRFTPSPRARRKCLSLFLSFVPLSSFGLLAFRAGSPQRTPELDSMVSRSRLFCEQYRSGVGAFTIF